MAKTVQITLTDDLTGGEATETVVFALREKSYEIDLNDANVKKLEKALQPYIDKGRSRKRGPGRPKGSGRGAPPLPDYDRPAFLEWAKKKGYQVPARGRTKSAWIDEFLAATKK